MTNFHIEMFTLYIYVFITYLMHEMFDCVDFESKKQEAKSKKRK